MVKYVYDVDAENFKREDNRGRPLYINIVEANRIINLLNLGNSVSSIIGRVQLRNPNGTETTIRSFIKNYKDGNIDVPTDAPAPIIVYNDMTEDSRIDELECRISSLEEKLDDLMDEKPTWRERLGI